MKHTKYALLLIGKSNPCSGGSRFKFFCYLSGIKPHAQCHLTVDMLSAALNKTLPSLSKMAFMLNKLFCNLNCMGQFNNYW